MSADVHPPRRVGPRRGPLRRLLETRGLLGGHRGMHVRARLRSRDGVPLAATYLPAGGGDVAVLVVHGFGAHGRKPAYARLADGLAARLPVLALDLRGHGRSGGWCTFGDREAADVAAGVAWLRRAGHPRVVVVAASMGATAALAAAAEAAAAGAGPQPRGGGPAAGGDPADHQGTPAGLVLVSPTARFRMRPQTMATRRLKRIWDSPVRRATLRAVAGVRLAGPAAWRHPPDPVELIARTPVPVLVVHGEDDAYFPVDDARDLVAAAGGPATLWVEPVGFGHAEDGLTPAFVAVLVEAVVAGARRGRFPERGPGRRELADPAP